MCLKFLRLSHKRLASLSAWAFTQPLAGTLSSWQRQPNLDLCLCSSPNFNLIGCVLAQEQSKEEMRFSTYGLLAQLALDGKPNVKLAYHNLTKQASNHKQLDRYTITLDREKVWVTLPPQSSGAEDPTGTNWTNIGKFLGNVNHLPNNYMQIAWGTALELQNGALSLQFDRPYLIWNKTMALKTDDYFRIA